MSSRAKPGQVPVAEVEVLNPPPGRIRLSNAREIRAEMATVYRLARLRQLDPQEATRLVYILDRIGKAYELEVIEQRLDALENAK